MPDPSLSIEDGVIAPWASARSEYFSGILIGLAEVGGFSVVTPWKRLKPKDRKLVLYGSQGKPVHIQYKNRFGRRRSYNSQFEGIVPWLTRRHSDAESDYSREQVEQYMREVDCPDCRGARLKPETLAITIGGMNIYELCSLSIARALRAVADLELSERDHMIADRVLKEVRERMQFLLDVGLEYLSLARSAGTLSGGEAQRIRLASQIEMCIRDRGDVVDDERRERVGHPRRDASPRTEAQQLAQEEDAGAGKEEQAAHPEALADPHRDVELGDDPVVRALSLIHI